MPSKKQILIIIAYTIIYLSAILITRSCKCQQVIPLEKYMSYTYKTPIKKYIPSILSVFGAGLTDGFRDASMYRMDGANNFWNGKQSWLNKYKNRDITQGRAYFGSTSFLVWTTDAPHGFNILTHQFNGMALAFMPPDNNKRFLHILLKVAAYNTIRQVGHYIVYDLIYKPQGFD